MKVTISCEMELTPQEGQEGADMQLAAEMWFKDNVGTYHEVFDSESGKKIGEMYIDEDPTTWSVKVGA